jgi:hypothetical protein
MAHPGDLTEPSNLRANLKREAQGELQNPRIAGRPSGRLQNLTEGWISDRIVRISEVCVIEYVERLRPKVDSLALGEMAELERKHLAEREI